MSAPLPRIYLARHGETEWTISGQHTGHTDIPLTAHGEEDARQLGVRLTGIVVPTVWTSPLIRARRTCDLAGFGESAQDDPDLMEWNYGDYEGKSTKQIRVERPDWKLFRDGCPNGESPADVGERADRIVAKVRANGGDCILFSHGHFLRFVAARWLGLPFADARLFVLTTTSVSILGYEHDLTEPVVRLWNDDGHIGVGQTVLK